MHKFNPDRIQIGISACLLGEKVRFDGGHKNSAYCQQELKPHFDFVPVCPEMAIGMGAPRKSIRQVRIDGEIRVRSADGSLDVTEPLQAFCDQKADGLGFLSGYLFCAKSPTCGMERVPVYKADGSGGFKEGVGVFAAALMKRFPHLPVEEEGRLHDLVIRENFFTRVYAYHDWHCMRLKGLSRKALTDFHARYKYLLLSHSPAIYRTLGPLLAGEGELEAVAEAYFNGFMSALEQKASRRNHTSALQHIQGYFKKFLSGSQKAELSDAILAYRQGVQPLLVPITLIRHYLREHPNDYIASQVYLNPHPDSLRLRYAY
ncbi:YbgA family protein [Shewanella litorisediminis]|uniref:DUF1722 domain-containing protein n=1 Tax=Shewanella litorisediminis TaxID=1173586 RepID=A0ABX7G5I3_9GAMM|nr:DUF523 and DUF1722 domain-containing protein [Shewanella litorisediminis]MCL2917427.1 DUF523 and DUF1722 domain-containing protein [Shewanella litorisediminis]QRH02560.1 DUF1722 domain-containing protein [Shewanella litorisediminis]